MGRVAAVALLVALSVVGIRLAAHGGDPSHFVRFGKNFTERGPDAPGFVRDDTGYDGQYFYRLARQPAARAERVDGVRFDRPVFRTRRIAYPVATWAASMGGQRSLVPWALIAVNVAATVALTAAAALLARDRGLSPWWGLVPAAWPGVLVGLTYDLAEVMAAGLLMAALLALRRGRWAWATAALTVGVLTREGLAVMAGVVLLGACLARLPTPLRTWRWWGRGPVPPAWVGAVPIAVLAAWQVILTWWFSGREGTASLNQAAEQLGLPLLGPVRQVVRFLGDLGSPESAYQFIQLLVVLLLVGILVRVVTDPTAGTRSERMALVAYLVLASTIATWDRAVVYFRYPTEVVMIGFALLLDVGPRLRGLAARAVAVLWVTSLPVWLTI